MTPVEIERDEQDQSEVFDETHLDDEGDGDRLLDELDDVLDVTQAEGDADDEELDLDEALALDGVEAEADALLGLDDPKLAVLEGEEGQVRSADEVELVYDGLMRNRRGAQASAAHWESRSLADDDIEDLGYGPDEASDDPVKTPE